MPPVKKLEIPRRQFLQQIAAGASAAALLPMLACRGESAPGPKGPAAQTMALTTDWLFGGKFQAAALDPAFDDSAFARVSLPHCVAKLSWKDWRFADWQDVWIYRRRFSLPSSDTPRRVFLHFDGVMSGARPVINGHALPEYVGGYLPFEYEITDWVREKNNVLAVAVDATWKNAPPEGAPKGPGAVDFFEPGGITQPVTLRLVPAVFLSDIFAKPVNVLAPDRRVEITGTVDAAMVPGQPLLVTIELFEHGRRIGGTSCPVTIVKTGLTEFQATLGNLGDVKLWDLDTPVLYDLVATLVSKESPPHDYRTRIGFREARFEIDGFFLNGRRRQIFGLNRQELFPYTGFAMPGRVMRHDAGLLRRDLNCNMVRCSHYPQSEAFLDACDELGMLVWEELPGWAYIGDENWKELAARDVGDMVRRDRNHPAIVIWGVRINESKNSPDFYRHTREIAKTLDDSRPTSGAMVGGIYSTKDWFQDVYAYNDYRRAPDDFGVDLRPPLPGVPFLITEAVGQIIGPPGADHMYRRAGDPTLQAWQAIYHAQAHDQAAADPRYAGVVAWCALEYGSPMNSYHGIKNPGVADVFRIPKLGASFYQSQVSPAIRPVIQPNFYWDFGSHTPNGPGSAASIFANCERLELYVDGAPHATLLPARDQFPHLAYPPFFADLHFEGARRSELRIDGYAGNRLVLSRSFSADPAQDQFLLQADDGELSADGVDATRLVFGRVDKYGSVRAFSGGQVTFAVRGPGELVGDNPFSLAEAGGTAAVWIRSVAAVPGACVIAATHSELGKKEFTIQMVAAAPKSFPS